MFRDPLGMGESVLIYYNEFFNARPGEGHTSVLQVSQPRDGIEYYSTPYSSVTSISAFFRPQTPRSSSDLPELKDLGSHSGVELYGTPRSSLNSTGTNETLFDVSLGPTSHHNLQNVDLPGTADVSVAFNHETGSSVSACLVLNNIGLLLISSRMSLPVFQPIVWILSALHWIAVVAL